MTQTPTVYDEVYAKNPRRMEWYGAGLDALDAVCKAMKEQGVKYGELSRRVGWSKKKLKRVLAEGTPTLKQVSHLLFALGLQVKITTTKIPARYKKLIN
jgi:hypothetical protein